MNILGRAVACALALAPAAASVPAQAQDFPWQTPYAKVLPQGDLEFTPEPFRYEAGPSVRYIDFEAGSDDSAGTSKQTPWKHHPWDPEATGQAKAARGAHTYVFKRGVVYRGRFRPGDDRGAPGNPIRLTSDPSWGQGEATVSGAQPVTGWKRGAAAGMPQPERVWTADVNYLPRTLWMTARDGDVTRLTLARTPNWKESDPNDVMGEWPTWENPEWWKNNNNFYSMKVNGKDKHLGIDTKNFTRPAEDYVGATVWTEWGIVMGSPYPARVEAFDEKQKGVAFRGPWTYDKLENIIRGNRYYLEDKAWMLDEPGEFWVERVSDNRGRIYLRLPGDVDPNGVNIEAGRHIHIIDAQQLNHVHISGLTFRFTNIHWEYDIPRWAHPDLQTAVVRLNGSGDDIRIDHCRFEHVHMPVRFQPKELTDRIGTVRIADNVMRYTDHGAVAIEARFGDGQSAQYAPVGHVELLRNHMSHIGWRILSGEHGHAVSIAYPETSHLAGNFLYRIAGWGLAVFGGKPSGRSGPEIPFARHLIHHNRVEDVLLKSNDWGGIETWQGGPFYVYDNIVINPVAFKNWTFRPGDPKSIGSFGHAYYLDGGFKNYYFNNIAKGRNNELGTKGVNTTALQNIISFENTFFHNTFYKFAETTRQQAPSAGRFRYLSNVIEDVSRMALRHADPKEGQPDPNASHYNQGGQFAYNTLAYHNNVFFNIRGDFGVFEETGFVYPSLETMRASLKRLNPQATDLGVMAPTQPLVDPAGGDFRPKAGSAAVGLGSRVFVPWSLYGTVGEWNFNRNNADPTMVIDEHWYMTANYGDRGSYKNTPRYPLSGRGITAASYVKGSLEDWTEGALRLNGKDQYLSLASDLVSASEPAPQKIEQEAARTVELPFARVTVPASVVPGKPFDVVVEAKPEFANLQVRSDLHWLKKAGFGGFVAQGGKPVPVAGSKAVKITFSKPAAPAGLDKYSLLVYLSPSGDYKEHTQSGTVALPVGKEGATADAGKARTVSMDTNSFLIEAVLQTGASEGLIAGKSDGKTGYLLDLVGGKPRLRLHAGGQELTATAAQPLAGAGWRHVLAEVDRKAGVVSLYLDGKKVDAAVTGTVPAGSLVNGADFLVGGGPGQKHLDGALDFLRVSRGTLADARTTIAELYAWQSNGPQHADFAGTSREQKNAAGALVGR